MGAEAAPDLAAHAQPVGRVEFGEAAHLDAEGHGVEAGEIGGIAVVARWHEPAGDAGAEGAGIDQAERDVVVARGVARLVAGLAERDDRRERELVAVVAFEFRRGEAGGADLQIPVAGEPAADAVAAVHPASAPDAVTETDDRQQADEREDAMQHEAPLPPPIHERRRQRAPLLSELGKI